MSGEFDEATRLRFPCPCGNDGNACAICAGEITCRWLVGVSHKGRAAVSRILGTIFVRHGGLGHVEGQDFKMLYRFAEFHADRLPQLALEMVQLKPDVIVAPATDQAVALRKATDTIPIVVGALADPVELGLIKSYAQPGGNLTGIMPYVSGLPTKQLELARELVPGS